MGGRATDAHAGGQGDTVKQVGTPLQEQRAAEPVLMLVLVHTRDARSEFREQFDKLSLR